LRGFWLEQGQHLPLDLVMAVVEQLDGASGALTHARATALTDRWFDIGRAGDAGDARGVGTDRWHT
jgi:hypothetical protein